MSAEATGSCAGSPRSDVEGEPAQRRVLCPGCSRPQRVCICDALPPCPLQVSTPVVLWQHPSEAKRPLQTGSILRLSLSSESFDIVTGRSFGCLSRSPLWQRIHAEGRVPLLLYPAPGAPTLQEVLATAAAGSRWALVAVDGTWKEAREMMHRGERDRAIAATPVTLGGDAAMASGVFAVRKPPAQGCLSTLEAVARALDALEPLAPQGEAPLSHALLRPMLRVVELQHALQRRTTHRPDRPGYRPHLAEEVAGALRSLGVADDDPRAASRQQDDERIEAALSEVGRTQDLYRWARDRGLYCTRAQLRGWLAEGAPLVIVDCRDEDAVGGMIRTALHLPDGSFGVASVRTVLEAARQRASARPAASSIQQPVRIVFHCMESVRRGPRCAKRLACALDALAADVGSADLPGTALHVLEGGFDQWVRRFWDDAQLVEGYDDEYYGYALMGGTQLAFDREREASDEEGDSDQMAPAHPLYHRPADQPATPWSAGGAELT